MSENLQKVYFPNLNGIRFIAAFCVIIHHTEQFKNILGYKSLWGNPAINKIGALGVILFFVLSGFLITYLLLVEENRFKTISIKSFYIRRILRIWPLYYLIVMISFFILPQIPFFNLSHWTQLIEANFSLKFLFFLLFLPNVALVLFTPVPYLSQSWSVGVEEQFYLIWPVLIKNVKNKKKLLYLILIGYLIIKIPFFYIFENFIYWNSYLKIFKEIFSSFSIDCMAIGGLFAVFLFEKNNILNLIYSKSVQIINFIVLTVMIGFGISIPHINFEFYSLLFGILIINLAANKNSIINLENKLFLYLGKISYGLYMYHPIAIMIALKTLYSLGISNIFIQISLVLFITVFLAGISYQYVESYFINKKITFSKIISGDDAK